MRRGSEVSVRKKAAAEISPENILLSRLEKQDRKSDGRDEPTQRIHRHKAVKAGDGRKYGPHVQDTEAADPDDRDERRRK